MRRDIRRSLGCPPDRCDSPCWRCQSWMLTTLTVCALVAWLWAGIEVLSP